MKDTFDKDAFSEEQIQAMSKGFSKAYKDMKREEFENKVIEDVSGKNYEPLKIWEYLINHPDRIYDAKAGVCFPSTVILEALKKFM